jgi:hypothetical protein
MILFVFFKFFTVSVNQHITIPELLQDSEAYNSESLGNFLLNNRPGISLLVNSRPPLFYQSRDPVVF